jgi:hypothetical protein
MECKESRVLVVFWGTMTQCQLPTVTAEKANSCKPPIMLSEFRRPGKSPISNIVPLHLEYSSLIFDLEINLGIYLCIFIHLRPIYFYRGPITCRNSLKHRFTTEMYSDLNYYDCSCFINESSYTVLAANFAILLAILLRLKFSINCCIANTFLSLFQGKYENTCSMSGLEKARLLWRGELMDSIKLQKGVKKKKSSVHFRSKNMKWLLMKLQIPMYCKRFCSSTM